MLKYGSGTNAGHSSFNEFKNQFGTKTNTQGGNMSASKTYKQMKSADRG